MKQLRTVIMLIVLSVVLVGCSDTTTTPETTLMGLGNFRVKGLGSTAEMSMRISNVNPDEITVTGLSVKLRVNGSSFAKAMGSLNDVVPGYGIADVRLPATVSNITMIRGAMGVAQSKKLDYELRADITYVDSDGKRTTRKISDRGNMDSMLLLGR